MSFSRWDPHVISSSMVWECCVSDEKFIVDAVTFYVFASFVLSPILCFPTADLVLSFSSWYIADLFVFFLWAFVYDFCQFCVKGFSSSASAVRAYTYDVDVYQLDLEANLDDSVTNSLVSCFSILQPPFDN